MDWLKLKKDYILGALIGAIATVFGLGLLASRYDDSTDEPYDYNNESNNE